MRVGAVGCGNVGLWHQRAFQSHPASTLVAVCDLDEKKAEERGRLLGVKAYPSLARMLESEALDAVDVVTADTLHFAPCLQALQAGKHVLVEKPLTIELAEAQQLVAEAAGRGLALAVNHNRRFGLAYQTGRRWLEEGRLGRLCYLVLRQAQGGPYGARKPYHLVWDMGCHMFDLLRHFGGEIVSMKAEMTDVRGTGYYTSLAVSAKFSTAAVGTLLLSWDSVFTNGLEYLELCGDRGRCTMHDVNRGACLYPHQGEEKVFAEADPFHGYRFEDTFTRRVHAFVDDVTAGRPPHPTGEDGLAALRLMYDCVRSFETDSVVKPQAVRP
ncbi:MAG: Gfo/Idh/MocA family oxidoreductase [Gemmatimonadota bacterium]